MEVMVKEADLVSIVLDFLHTRQLYEGALALERETGCLSASDQLLPEDLQFLRGLALDGEWTVVLSYLEPFTHLEEFDTKTSYYLVLRQRYFEALHSISLSKNHSQEDTSKLEAILDDVRPYCSQEQFHQLSQARDHSDLHDWSVIASRFRCFNNILSLIGPLYEDDLRPSKSGGSGDGWRVSSNGERRTQDRLLPLVTDALLYNECIKYCRERALGASTNDTDLPWLSTQDMNRNNDGSDVNASLLLWLRALNDNRLFQQPFEEEDVMVKIEQLKKRMTHRDLQHVSEQPKKLSSFISPTKPQRDSTKIVSSPIVARSLQLPTGGKERMHPSILSSSGPAHHTYHTSRNMSNNNNNEHSSREDIGEEQKKPESEPNGVVTENLIEENVKTESQNDRTYMTPHLGENLPQASLQSPKEGSQTDVVESSRVENVPKVNKQSLKSSSVGEDRARNAPVPESRLLKDKANIFIENGVPFMDDKAPETIKVQDSYAEFMEEKKRLQTEKQNFLRDLEEKEKEKDVIRNILLNQQTGSEENKTNHGTTHTEIGRASQSEPFQKPDNKQETLDAAVSKDLNENHPPPAKYQYTNVEFTEDVQAIRAVSFHPSGMVYAVGSNSRTLRICEVPRDIVLRAGSRKLSMYSRPEGNEAKPSKILAQISRLHKGSIYCMAWNEDGSFLATGSNDKLVKFLGFDILGKSLEEKPQEMAFHRGIVREVVFLYGRGNELASGGGDGTIYITDCVQKKNITQLPGHSDHVLSLFSWHTGMMASSSQDKSIRLWDIRTPRCVSIIGTGTSEPSVPTSICVDPGGRWLAMGLDNNKIGLYDLKAGKSATEFEAHSGEVRSVRFNPEYMDQLLSSSYDGTIAITDVAEILSEGELSSSKSLLSTTVARCGEKVIQCRWHPSGEDFASTSVDKTCKLWHRVDAH